VCRGPRAQVRRRSSRWHGGGAAVESGVDGGDDEEGEEEGCERWFEEVGVEALRVEQGECVDGEEREGDEADQGADREAVQPV
jgi:hypothetical protein